jgi:hypothetical protein
MKSDRKKVKVSGCIVTYNNASMISECVESILKWTKDLDFTLYISDNHSTDGTVELIRRKFPEAVIIENEQNKGFGEGHNRVLNRLDSNYHFVINPDILVTEDVFSVLCQYLEEHKDVAMITPKILNEDGTEQFLPKRNPTIRYMIISKFKPFKHYRKIYTRELEHLNEPTEVDFCTGCFFGIRTTVFKRLKGFDRRYFMYMEDADLSRMVRKKYRIIFDPEVFVYHKWSRENTRSMRGILRWFKSMVKYFMKWGWKF